MQKKNIRAYLGDPDLDAQIGCLIESAGVTLNADLYRELVVNILKLAKDKPNTGDLKLITRSFREIRVANRVFAQYRDTKKVAVFGSARTKPGAKPYEAAKNFGKMLVDAGFMVITGGGDGIMGAAQAGAGRAKSFGLNILLPFEQQANETILNDSKLITFKYFFTRKLNFVKESHAITCFPGGFGTMDEAFETITLIQTGKSTIVPLLFIDAPGGTFWKTMDHYIREHFLGNGLISPDDFHLYKITDSLEEALNEINTFYKNFHSYRMVEDKVMIRIHREIPRQELDRINEDFEDVCVNNPIYPCEAHPYEQNEPEILHLPRLLFPFNRRHFGRFRQLIDRINQF